MTNMLYFEVCFLLLAFIRMYNSSTFNKIRDVPLTLEQIKTKNETILKVVKQEEYLDYPGNNYEKLAKIKDLWEKYYNCLNERAAHEKDRKPVMLQIMEGQYISLKCPFCQKPLQGNEKLNWKYKPLISDVYDPGELQILDLASQMTISHKMTLKIYNAITGYSGIYVCYYGNSPVSVYVLEILSEQQITELNDLPTQKDIIPFPDGTELGVYYSWSKWTECSNCDKIGKKYKYGTCMAKIIDTSHIPSTDVPVDHLTVKRPTAGLTKYSKIKKSQMPLESSNTKIAETEFAKTMISKFEKGIPCTSKLMPNPVRLLIESLNKTPAAALINYCKVPCTKASIFQVVDRNGRVLEAANNTAGIYSSYQKIPRTAPEVERKTITANFGEDIVFQCPGNLITDTPVSWMIQEQLLIPELIKNESNGRITIDLLNRLHIKHLRQKDTNVYSCWQRLQLAGTITLNVDKKLKFSYDHHIMLLSMLTVAITFIYIGIKVLTREIKMRKT